MRRRCDDEGDTLHYFVADAQGRSMARNRPIMPTAAPFAPPTTRNDTVAKLSVLHATISEAHYRQA
jgi:hypothetical protein